MWHRVSEVKLNFEVWFQHAMAGNEAPARFSAAAKPDRFLFANREKIETGIPITEPDNLRRAKAAVRMIATHRREGEHSLPGEAGVTHF
jgi:hypothetical protein